MSLRPKIADGPGSLAVAILDSLHAMTPDMVVRGRVGRSMSKHTKIPIALTIAGSDSGGGAGIQADLKTFSALGVYGASVITALTAQNTQGVTGIHDAPPDFITAQIDAVFSDLDVKAVKIGMVSRPDAITAIVDGLKRWKPAHVVLDPVMVATSGDRLLVARCDRSAAHASHSAAPR